VTQEEILSKNRSIIGNIEVEVEIRVGSTKMLIEDILKLGPQAIIKLNKSKYDPLDVFVNGVLFARGTVVKISGRDTYGIKITEFISPDQRM
jgi:flagellar motor switch protein FliN/FliY